MNQLLELIQTNFIHSPWILGFIRSIESNEHPYCFVVLISCVFRALINFNVIIKLQNNSNDKMPSKKSSKNNLKILK